MLHGPLVEVDLWESLVHFVKLQLVLPLLNICIGSWMLRDWLPAAFLCTVLLLVLRLCLGRSPFVCLACCRLCSSLACRWLCSCLARCWLCSSLFFSSLLQIFVFSRCPRTSVALLRSSLLFTTGSLDCGPVWDSHHLLLGCGSVFAFSSGSLLWYVTTPWLVSGLTHQHHNSALRPS